MEERENKGCDFMLHHIDDADEAVSLCDLPIGEEDGDNSARSPCHVRRSTTEEFFEFLTDFNSEMCSAKDIIVGGKLAPSHDGIPVRSRSESLYEAKFAYSSQSDISKSSLMRNCRSLDYNKIYHHPVGSERCQHSRPTHCNSSEKSVSATLAYKNRSSSSPRWYVIMFGPGSRDLYMMDRFSDIKSRHLRRSPSKLETEAERKDPTGRSGFKALSWKFLQWLSCQSRASVAVSMSYEACNKAS